MPVLPPTLIRADQFLPTTTTQNSPMANKRPKLSLQTTILPLTYGASSTGLALTASAIESTTPTVLNTFNNAYSIPFRPSPSSATPRNSRNAQQFLAQTPARKDIPPYSISLPMGVKPILRNSLKPHLSYANSGTSPRYGRRVFFPAVKMVTFRSGPDLEEIVKTTTYVAAHSDLSESEDSGQDSDSENEDAISTASEDHSEAEEGGLQFDNVAKGQGERQIIAEAIRERRQRDLLTPKLRIRSRRKRKWQWTLGSLDDLGTHTQSVTKECLPVNEGMHEDTREDRSVKTDVQHPGFLIAVEGAQVSTPVPISEVVECKEGSAIQIQECQGQEPVFYPAVLSSPTPSASLVSDLPLLEREAVIQANLETVGHNVDRGQTEIEAAQL